MPTERRKGDRRQKSQTVRADRRVNNRRSTADRRSSVRLPLELWMEELSGDDVYFRQTGNVSTGGVFLESAIPHPEGTVITLKFALPGDREMVVARGEVVAPSTKNGTTGMHIRFKAIEGSGKTRLQDYIRINS